jgi:CheY-like chemotaxis protein
MKTLILLEDEPLVMKLFRHWLKHFNVIAATTGEEALQAFDNLNSLVDLLITDVRLPGPSGIQVALRMRSGLPGLPILLLSGYPVGAWRGADGEDLGRLGTKSVALLQKPFQAEAFLNAVSKLLGTVRTDTVPTAA